ncbi:MAG TPA: hypothetical protein VHG08_16765 [Longimicrobium sp.]|nr:hypothetical protein [Longimicrobium sp.]
MNVESIVRRLRGAVVNAVVWGAAWFGLTVASFAAVRVTGAALEGVSLLDAIFVGMRAGVIGGVAGGAFSVFISLFYGGRRLSAISPVRFGGGGGIVAGLFVPAFFVTANLLSGQRLPALELVTYGGMAALFGGVAAGASMWFAQRAETWSIGGPDQHDRLHAGSAPLGGMTPRAARPVDRATRGSA